MNKKIFRFYSSLIFLYFSDMTLLMSVMWLSYEVTQSAFFLSAMLSISAILPFILKKVKLRLDLLGLSLPQLMKLRIIIYLCLILICLFIGISYFSLILFSLFIGLLSVTILSSYEAKNTQLVLENKIEKSFAARAIQTVIQVGAFIGAMLGSFMLKQLGFEQTVYIISALDISICFILLWLEEEPITENKVQAQNHCQVKPTFFVYIFSSLLGLIGLHISTFNFTTPIIFQNINQWQVTEFGLASGFAGIGAFLAVFCKLPTHFLRPLLALFILVDCLFTFNQSLLAVAPLCFAIGFCMNTLRIALRERLIELAENTQQAVTISGISASFYMLIQSSGTLMFGILLGILPNIYLPRLLLPAIALVLSLCFLCFYFRYQTNE